MRQRIRHNCRVTFHRFPRLQHRHLCSISNRKCAIFKNRSLLPGGKWNVHVVQYRNSRLLRRRRCSTNRRMLTPGGRLGHFTPKSFRVNIFNPHKGKRLKKFATLVAPNYKPVSVPTRVFIKMFLNFFLYILFCK